MAEVEPGPALDLILNETDSNGTEALNGSEALNGTTASRFASPEGTALAYGSLVIMALLPIFFGALRSVTCSKSKMVFGTNVMVTVAKSFEAPIKLVFPQDLLEKGLEASNFAMLGLGDIVIPGIFIALLLRFDVSLKKNSRTYFYSSFLAYIFGLGLTIFVMHTFKHAQPALLYLVPACVGFPVVVALLKGELTEMFRYEETSPEEAESKEDSSESEKKDQ
ncbi:LOW QUALITY PROTEIN: minor histocompatibility antigen H13 [Polymixia lowei]